MKSAVVLCLIVVVIFMASACKQNHTPKPRGYFRIDLPEKEYQQLNLGYPYNFEHPKYVAIEPDSTGTTEPYWINIDYKKLNGKIHISYKPVNDNLYALLEDSRKFAYKHAIKADAINERLFQSPDNNVTGILYEIKGNAASPMQFFATDSLKHFIRGSVYFNAVPNKDSLAPVISFVHKDVIRLMETLKWSN